MRRFLDLGLLKEFPDSESEVSESDRLSASEADEELVEEITTSSILIQFETALYDMKVFFF